MDTETHEKSPLMTLTVEQQMALDQLMLGLSDREVAEKVGVRRETITRWRNYHPAFQAELNRRRQELWDNGLERLRLVFPEAVEALRSVINDTSNPHRWKAALEVIGIVKLPENLMRYNGSDSAEEVLWSRAKRKKNRLPCAFSEEEPTEDDILAMVKELEANLE